MELLTLPSLEFRNIFSHVGINSKKNDRKKTEEGFGSFLGPGLLQAALPQDRARARARAQGSTRRGGAASPSLSLPVSCQDQVLLSIVIQWYSLEFNLNNCCMRGVDKHASYRDSEEKWKKAKTTKISLHRSVPNESNRFPRALSWTESVLVSWSARPSPIGTLPGSTSLGSHPRYPS